MEPRPNQSQDQAQDRTVENVKVAARQAARTIKAVVEEFRAVGLNDDQAIEFFYDSLRAERRKIELAAKREKN